MTSPGVPVSPADISRAMDAISPYVRSTPVIEVPGDEFGIDATLVIKLEFVQRSGAFKARGATHYIATQPIADTGIVAASGGNHGAAVAWAAQRLGHEATIFVPTTSAPAKVARLAQYGATIRQVGEVYGDALAASREFLAQHAATSIHAFDDPIVMAGAGTCAMELEGQAGHLDAVLLACGGGGLSGGAAAWFGDRAEIVVCETDRTPTYAQALAAGEPVDVQIGGVAADALGAPRLGSTPWTALSAVAATSALVSDDELVAAQHLVWDRLRLAVEPAAAAPIAVLLSGRWQPSSAGRRVGIVLSGANRTIE
ncbi:MAG: serine/threonine dehydratase [Acidimicrobiia bacterium]|nr:serine/threonine dehydratase [Acidimicrobiia bacterium]